jgi:hypothetical protein
MAWSCAVCTFSHDSEAEFEYLSCSMCGARREDSICGTRGSDNQHKLKRMKKVQNDENCPIFSTTGTLLSMQQNRYHEAMGPFESSKILLNYFTRKGAEKAPVVLRKLGERMKCCKKWDSNAYLADKCGHSYSIRSFMSEVGQFHLDGTNNPRTILTCSLSQETTINKFLRVAAQKKKKALLHNEATLGANLTEKRAQVRKHKEEEEGEDDDEWESMYALDENFDKKHPLAFDVPPLPFPRIRQAENSTRGSGGNSGGGGGGNSGITTGSISHGYPSHEPAIFSSTTLINRQLFLSRGKTETQIHRDCNDNIYMVASGVRVWYLIDPTESNSTLLLNHLNHLNDINHKDYAISSLYQPVLDSFFSPPPPPTRNPQVSAANAEVSGGGGGGGETVGHFKHWYLNSPSSSSPPASPTSSSSPPPHSSSSPPPSSSSSSSSFPSSSLPDVSESSRSKVQDMEQLEQSHVRSELCVHRVVLGAGDGIFVPAGWWHMVVALPPFSTAVNW